jgi:hypothetical protein
LIPRSKTARPLPEGLTVLLPSSAGNIAAVFPGTTVESCSFGSVPAVMRRVGIKRERRARKERKKAMRVVRRVERMGNRRAPIIIQVVVRKFEEIMGFSMKFMKAVGAERSFSILDGWRDRILVVSGIACDDVERRLCESSLNADVRLVERKQTLFIFTIAFTITPQAKILFY